MIHLLTAAGGHVEHLTRPGQVVRRGDLLARITPASGPAEEVVSPLDALVAQVRFLREPAPQFAHVVGLTRVVLATAEGRIKWIATLGPVGITSLVALLETTSGTVRPHRAGGSGFVGQHFAKPGDRVVEGAPLIEIRGDELG